MQSTSNQCRVYQCSQCTGDTEFFCFTCQCDLCLQCKQIHLELCHNVVIFREKLSCIQLSEMCAIHPHKVYRRICGPCQVPLCDSCSEHNIPKFRISLNYFKQTEQHGLRKIRAMYKEKRQSQRKIITIIRTEGVLYRSAVDIMNSVVQRKVSHIRSMILRKVQRLEIHIASVLRCKNHENQSRLIHNLQKQNIHEVLSNGQLCERIYEQSAKYPLQYLLFIKKSSICQILEHTSYYKNIEISMTESKELTNVFDWFCNIKFKA